MSGKSSSGTLPQPDDRHNDVTEHSKFEYWSSRKRQAVAIALILVLQRLGAWQVLADGLQSFWGSAYDWCEGERFCVAFTLPTIIPQAFFWSLNLLLIIMEVTRSPAWLRKYKTQTEAQVSNSDILKAVRLAAFNMSVMWLASHVVTYQCLWYRGSVISRELPSWYEVMGNVLVITLVEEAGFYYFHRLFHQPMFYKRIHKIHHEFTAPIGVASVYAHPLEHLCANILPVMAGPLLCGAHVAILCLWYTIALVQTTFSHCGYHLPFSPSNEQHDYHHLQFNQNFGVMGWLDRFHGTNSKFRSAVEFKRHKVLMSTTPMKQLIPDEKID